MAFDIVFGVVGPIACFIWDPIVFRGMIGGILSRFQLFAYATCAIVIVALMVWLCFADRLGFCGPLIGGVLFAGATLSAVIGVIILPFSIAGLFVLLVGLAGFTPFFTAFVFLRNAVRAFKAQQSSRRQLKSSLAIAASVVAVVLPAIISYQVAVTISTTVDQLLAGDADQARVASERLQRMPFLPDASLDPVVRAYVRETDGRKKAVLKKYYEDAMGENIDRRRFFLDD